MSESFKDTPWALPNRISVISAPKPSPIRDHKFHGIHIPPLLAIIFLCVLLVATIIAHHVFYLRINGVAVDTPEASHWNNRCGNYREPCILVTNSISKALAIF